PPLLRDVPGAGAPDKHLAAVLGVLTNASGYVRESNETGSARSFRTGILLFPTRALDGLSRASCVGGQTASATARTDSTCGRRNVSRSTSPVRSWDAPPA